MGGREGEEAWWVVAGGRHGRGGVWVGGVWCGGADAAMRVSSRRRARDHGGDSRRACVHMSVARTALLSKSPDVSLGVAFAAASASSTSSLSSRFACGRVGRVWGGVQPCEWQPPAGTAARGWTRPRQFRTRARHEGQRANARRAGHPRPAGCQHCRGRIRRGRGPCRSCAARPTTLSSTPGPNSNSPGSPHAARCTRSVGDKRTHPRPPLPPSPLPPSTHRHDTHDTTQPAQDL